MSYFAKLPVLWKNLHFMTLKAHAFTKVYYATTISGDRVINSMSTLNYPTTWIRKFLCIFLWIDVKGILPEKLDQYQYTNTSREGQRNNPRAILSEHYSRFIRSALPCLNVLFSLRCKLHLERWNWKGRKISLLPATREMPMWLDAILHQCHLLSSLHLRTWILKRAWETSTVRQRIGVPMFEIVSFKLML